MKDIVADNEAAIHLRIATPNDAEALLQIYAPYVINTAITFEYTVPSIEEFANRIQTTLKKYPYLVVEVKGVPMGYAYLSDFVGRAAYAWGAETSIYLRQDAKRMGLGGRLYAAIEAIAKLQNLKNLNACIGYPKLEDEHLNKNSVQFHRHLGFRMVGRFNKCGFKFNRWYDMVWMEKSIARHTENPKPVVPFSQLNLARIHHIINIEDKHENF